MKYRKTCLARSIISVLTTFSILLTACEVKFEPDVVPLVIEEAPGEPVASDIAPGDSSLEALPPAEEAGTEPPSEFSSSDALALCGAGLSWGDETMGMCLAPGGDTYFVWTNEGNVIRVVADATDISQVIFQQAARDRASAISEIKSQRR